MAFSGEVNDPESGPDPFAEHSVTLNPTLKGRNIREAFKTDEKMGIYVQLYNFEPDAKTQKPEGTVEYEVVKNGNNEKVFEFAEEVAKIENASANQVTIEKVLPLKNLEPGQYTIRMKVTDRKANQTVNPTATFTVL